MRVIGRSISFDRRNTSRITNTAITGAVTTNMSMGAVTTNMSMGADTSRATITSADTTRVTSTSTDTISTTIMSTGTTTTGRTIIREWFCRGCDRGKPYAAVASIEGHLAFYRDRVDSMQNN